MNVVLENATVVHSDRVDMRPLAFSKGRVAASAPDAVCIDLRGHLIFPGLINAHDHLQLNAIPPLAQEGPFGNSYAWIDEVESQLQSQDALVARHRPSETRHWHGALKNLLAGVTTVAHHDPWCDTLDDPSFPVRLVHSGWSHSLRLGSPRQDGAPRYGPPVRDSFCATPSARPWIIHLAEGTDDVAEAELRALDVLGCLAPNTVIVHGVGLTGADVSRVIDAGAAVTWCPASNLGMLGRTLDPRTLFDAGRLSLGTDSRLTGSRDLLDELRIAAAHSDLLPAELLRLVTSNASAVLRLPESGGLHEDQHADCLIIRDGGNPYEALLHATRSSIRAVIRGGMPVIADPDFADWFEHCGVAVVEGRLDGQPKLIAREIARPEAMALEPGLEIL